VLFSEPKIPQKEYKAERRIDTTTFQCSSASRKFLKTRDRLPELVARLFQCSSASRKFLKTHRAADVGREQSRFSALQRAENSSNLHVESRYQAMREGFSALQRAENSSNLCHARCCRHYRRFQCSSASRKFLKRGCRRRRPSGAAVSVLFSEPKIPQNLRRLRRRRGTRCVSVLFSEPKIPQTAPKPRPAREVVIGFSALQRAENSSKRPRVHLVQSALQVSVLFSEPKIPQNRRGRAVLAGTPKFQCSSASRKFLKFGCSSNCDRKSRGFSALQRAENSSNLNVRELRRPAAQTFQCSSASRKFLKLRASHPRAVGVGFQCSSASRKFLKLLW